MRGCCRCGKESHISTNYTEARRKAWPNVHGRAYLTTVAAAASEGSWGDQMWVNVSSLNLLCFGNITRRGGTVWLWWTGGESYAWVMNSSTADGYTCSIEICCFWSYKLGDYRLWLDLVSERLVSFLSSTTVVDDESFWSKSDLNVQQVVVEISFVTKDSHVWSKLIICPWPYCWSISLVTRWSREW